MSTIAYIGNFGFPDKNASGKRVLGNCKVLQKIGYSVVCIGPGKEELLDYDGIKVYSIDTGNSVTRVVGSKVDTIEEILRNDRVEKVILYGAIFTQKENVKIVKWCHKQGIKVYYDQVDWLDVNWHNPLRGLIRLRNYSILNNKVIPACDGVICISSYLQDIHASNGKKTVIIPPLSLGGENETSEVFKKNDRPVQLVYAGTSSDINRPTSQWKDRIDIMFEELMKVSNSATVRQFLIDIYGLTENQYIRMFPVREQEHGRNVISSLGNHVIFHGNVSNKEAMQRIREADFTILIRDKKRATMSGFPTKVSESISCGTPVLCNDTSDIKKYVVQGKTGFVTDDISQLIEQGLSLTNNQLSKMKEACADNPFYYENYKDRLATFLDA